MLRLPRNAERFGGQAITQLKDKLLNTLDGFDDAKIYVEWLVEKYPRYVRDQLRIMYQCVTVYSRDELKKALDYCVSRDLISANDFRDTLIFFRQDEPKIAPASVALPAKYRAVAPKVRSIKDYLKDNAKKGEA